MYLLLELENFVIDNSATWDLTLGLTCHAAVAQLEVLTLQALVVTEVTGRALNTRVFRTSSLFYKKLFFYFN